MQYLRQVALKRPSDTGYYYDVFWIDEELAKVGKAVIDEDRVMWVVAEVFGRRPKVVVDTWEKTQRRVADVLEGC